MAREPQAHAPSSTAPLATLASRRPPCATCVAHFLTSSNALSPAHLCTRSANEALDPYRRGLQPRLGASTGLILRGGALGDEAFKAELSRDIEDDVAYYVPPHRWTEGLAERRLSPGLPTKPAALYRASRSRPGHRSAGHRTRTAQREQHLLTTLSDEANGACAATAKTTGALYDRAPQSRRPQSLYARPGRREGPRRSRGTWR